MKIKKVDDKPMVIHTKQKAKIHTHEPKQASIKGSNIYTVDRDPTKKKGAEGSHRKSTGGDRMQEFQIEIKEELARVETIQAETLGEAIDKAMELYYDQKIILDAEDMKGVDFQPMQPEKKR